MRLAFIGGGTMAEAIIGGVLSAKLATPEDICVGEPVPERCQYLSSRYGVPTDQDNFKLSISAVSVTIVDESSGAQWALPIPDR